MFTFHQNIYLFAHSPRIHFKKRLAQTEVYVNVEKKEAECFKTNYIVCERAETVVIVFDFQGPLIFINSSLFRSRFDEMIMGEVRQAKEYGRKNFSSAQIRVIFDCSRLTYIDVRGAETLAEIHAQLTKASNAKRVQLLLANLNSTCYEMLNRCQFFERFELDRCFMTVHDAYVNSTNGNSNITINNNNNNEF